MHIGTLFVFVVWSGRKKNYNYNQCDYDVFVGFV